MDYEKKTTRRRMAVTGEKYTVALRNIRIQGSEDPEVQEMIWALAAHRNARKDPFLPPGRIPVEERGIRALGPDPAPEQKAHAEAWWRPVPASEPCPCSGQCSHGEPCSQEGGFEYCPGHMIHTDRTPRNYDWSLPKYPPRLFSWDDNAECDTCHSSEPGGGADLPEVPWGEWSQARSPEGPRRMVLIYPGSRHPFLPEDKKDKPSSPLWDPWAGCDDDDLDPDRDAFLDGIYDLRQAVVTADPSAGLPGAAAAARAAIAPGWHRGSPGMQARQLTRWTDRAAEDEPAGSALARISPLAARLLQLHAEWRASGIPKPGEYEEDTRSHAVHAAEAAASRDGEAAALEAAALLGAWVHYRTGISARIR